MMYAAAFLCALLFTFAATPMVIRFASYFHLVDDTSRIHPAKTHQGSIPRAGGLAIAAGTFIPILLFLGYTRISLGIIIAGSILILVGLLDDKNDVNPYIRLFTNTISALIIVASGVAVPYITNPFGGILHLDTLQLTLSFFGTHTIIIWSSIFALLWILWTINIIEWSAGVEGQMPGFVAIAAVILGILALRFRGDAQTSQVLYLSAITAGAFIGFLPWNFYPQKIMPGYGGKTLAGLLLAVLGILSYGKVGTALLVLGIPTFDAVFTLVRRIQNRKSPVWADRGHLHHRLLDLGWGKRRIAIFYWVVTAILGIIALSVTSKQKLFVLLLVAVALGGFIVWIKLFTQLSKPPDQDNG